MRIPVLTMIAVATVLVGAGVTAPTASSARAALPTPPVERIAEARAIGGVALGSTLARARAAWGPGVCSKVGGGRICTFRNAKRPALGEAYFITGSAGVTRIAILASRPGRYTFAPPLADLRTGRGIHLGSTLPELRRAYRGLVRTPQFGAADFTLQGRGAITTFSVAGGRVVGIAVAIGRL